MGLVTMGMTKVQERYNCAGLTDVAFNDSQGYQLAFNYLSFFILCNLYRLFFFFNKNIVFPSRLNILIFLLILG